MGDPGAHVSHFAAPPIEARALGFIVLAAVLIGIGLLMLMAWIVSLTTDWFWAAGLLPVALGTIVLFLPQSGPDRS
ncbi:MAG: hypothetical protein L3K15_00800 [Thermoplasmata archaeon]|nr:hypothetical protein [Thermoplasmata archaeon]